MPESMNKSSLNSSTEAGITIDSKLEQKENALSPNSLIGEVIIISDKPEEVKAVLSTASIEGGS